MRAGVIRNPHSQRNRTRPLREASLPEGVVVELPFTKAALAETLKGFADQGIRDLMVDGGDGTLRDVLCALPAAYGEAWPSIALCASGNTNLAVADVGGFARSDAAIARWHATLTGAAPVQVTVRQPIRVRWPDGSHPDVFGFFVGCANYAAAVAMATGSVREKGFFHGWAVGATIAGAAWQVLMGGADNSWQRGSPLTLAIDDKKPSTGPRFVVLATSLDRLVLSLWPFWAEPIETGALKWLDIAAPPPRFGRALPAILRGKPKDWMLADGAYRSGRADRLRLSLAEPLIIDGEPFAPDGKGELELSLGPAVQFHAPV